MPGIPFALKFGAAATDAVDCGSLGSWDPTTSFTVLQWVYPTTLTLNRAYWTKSNIGNGVRLIVTTTTSEMRVIWGGATAATYDTTDAGITVNRWWFVVTVVNKTGGAGAKFAVYVGNLLKPALAATMSVVNEGVTLTSIASDHWQWGNRQGNSFAWQGLQSVGAVFDRALPLDVIRQIQAEWGVASNGRPKLLSTLAKNGTGGVLDESGNGYHGTITGAIPTSDYLPGVRRQRAA